MSVERDRQALESKYILAQVRCYFEKQNRRPEALKIEREMKFDSFVSNIQLQMRNRQVKNVFGIIRTA